VIDPAAVQMVLCVLTGWLDRREREAVAYLIEENRLLCSAGCSTSMSWQPDRLGWVMEHNAAGCPPNSITSLEAHLCRQPEGFS
jgi:hypothetical protein